MQNQGSHYIGTKKPPIIDKKLGIRNKFHKNLDKSDILKSSRTPQTVNLSDLINKKSDIKKGDSELPLINEHKKGLKPAIFVIEGVYDTNKLSLEQRKKLITSATYTDISRKGKLKNRKGNNYNDEDSLDRVLESTDSKIMKTPNIFSFKMKRKKTNKKENVDLFHGISFSTSQLPDF